MPPKPRKQPTPISLGVASNTIPLHCLLCPKKPSFSDVSHLLTHISSKSHLSNRFKMEIRSGKERGAKDTIDRYEDWYNRYGIQGLLADRMSAKDKKMPPKRGRGKSQLLNTKPSHDDDDDEEYMVKVDEPEPLSRRDTNESLHAHSSRQTSVYSHSPYVHDSSFAAPTDQSVPHLNSTSRPFRRIYPAIGTPGQNSTSDSAEPSVASELEHADASPQADIDVISIKDADKSKLKGVIWGGMGLFDSATPTQKRKRNQRKDVSVMRNMEQVAASVEPTECIWTRVRDCLQRTRNIYATPTPEPEGDEDGAAPPPKKKRTRRPTAAPTQVRVQARPTRASARISKAKKTKPSDILETLDDYVLDAEVQRTSGGHPSSDDIDVNMEEERDVLPDELKSEDTGMSIWHDSPAAAFSHPGQGTDIAAHAVKYEQQGRRALQPLDSNLAISSPTTNTFKATPGLRRGQSDFGLRSDAVNHGNYYAHNHQMFAPNTQSSLFGGVNHQFSQQQAYHPYHHGNHGNFGNQGFAGDARPLNNFHPINGQTSHVLPADLNPYQLSTGAGGFYHQGQPPSNFDG